ncbi:hypothetical protein OKA04_12950 [Luteolibacter flavescens]|uniref:Uncharacterized protein n=1 Tax=Luteolibacter flavescens TaxID=1859460 RepID=A0ABT3FRN8_9BACT|nr:hypothetical protein [Luteolibacter flavescens]MCW1885640.1 hypothetical protein [Luteolibacter flavescens]
MDGSTFLWHYSAHCPLCSADVFTVGREGQPFVLFIDPRPWEFEIRPASVVAAIRWALAEGWTPEKGPTRAMAHNDMTHQFEWLPDGERHLKCNTSPLSKEQAIAKYGLDGWSEWMASEQITAPAVVPGTDQETGQ